MWWLASRLRIAHDESLHYSRERSAGVLRHYERMANHRRRRHRLEKERLIRRLEDIVRDESTHSGETEGILRDWRS